MDPWMVMLGVVLVGVLALALFTAAAMRPEEPRNRGQKAPDRSSHTNHRGR
jgi:hypothetical protein